MATKKEGPHTGVYSLEPDAIDLLQVERRIDELEKERVKVENKSFLIPGRKEAELKKLDAELLRLGWKQVEMREHIQASPAKAQVYQTMQKHAQQAAEADKEIEARHAEIARKEVQQATNKKMEAAKTTQRGLDGSSEPSPAETAQQRREELQAFVREREEEQYRIANRTSPTT